MEQQFARTYRIGVLTSALVLVLMFGLSAWGWANTAPALAGPLRFGLIFSHLGPLGSKIERFALAPLVTLLLVLFQTITPLHEPRRANLERSRRTYFAFWMGFLALGALVHVVRVLPALGYDWTPRVVGPVGLGLLLLCLALAGQLRPMAWAIPVYVVLLLLGLRCASYQSWRRDPDRETVGR